MDNDDHDAKADQAARQRMEEMVRSQRRKDPTLIIIVLVFGLIGSGLVWWGFQMFQTHRVFLAGAVEVPAVVVENPLECSESFDQSHRRTTSSSSGDTCVYWPTFEFRAANGELVQQRVHLGSLKYDFEVGSDMPVLVNAEFDRVRLPEAREAQRAGYALLGFGGICLLPLLAVVAARGLRRRKA
ncbi:MAG: hypothetical protein AAFX00_07490 [Pseudomonadota bacterium]